MYTLTAKGAMLLIAEALKEEGLVIRCASPTFLVTAKTASWEPSNDIFAVSHPSHAQPGKFDTSIIRISSVSQSPHISSMDSHIADFDIGDPGLIDKILGIIRK